MYNVISIQYTIKKTGPPELQADLPAFNIHGTNTLTVVVFFRLS